MINNGNGNVTRQMVTDLGRRTDKVEEEIPMIHGRITRGLRDFDRLIGSIGALKWICGGGFIWIIIQDIVKFLQ